MKSSSLYHEIVRIHPELRVQPRSHSEYFQTPLELASGLANADVVLSGDGSRPLTSGGEIVIVRHPRALSPGTFGRVRGRLRKAKSQASIKSQRWHSATEEARTLAAQERVNRLRAGMWAGTVHEQEVLQAYHLPKPPRCAAVHAPEPRSSPPPPPPTTVPQPSNWQPPPTPPGLLAFCAHDRLRVPPFRPREIGRVYRRVVATTSNPAASAWGASRL